MANPFAVAARGMRPQANVYQGAAGGRLNADWVMWRMSANSALRFDAPTLRFRARELVINNSSASAIPAIYSENVIGKDGILLQAKIESSRGNPNKTINARIEAAWTEWCEFGTCTADGRASFEDVLKAVIENEAVDGEVLLQLIDGFDGNRFGFAVQLLDPDQLDHYYNVPPAPGQNAIWMGVEENQWGRPVAYHLWTAHPTDPQGKERRRVPADQILHLFIQRRPRQSRGVTWFAPFVFDLKMLGGYRESELVASRTASAKQGFLQTTADAVPPMRPKDGEDEIVWDAEPGVIQQLPPGYQFVGWDPKHPSTAFDAFDKANLRSIATAARLAYMSVSGDLTGTSYSSGRLGSLNERSVFQWMQERTIRRACQPIYRRWLRASLLTGALDLGSFDSTRFHAVKWHPRSFPWVDPQKDIDAALREADACITSLQRIAAQKGHDIYEIIDEQAEVIAYAKAKGVPLVIGTGTSHKATQVDEVQQAEDDTGQAPADDEADDGADDATPPKTGALRLRAVAGGRE